MEPCLASELLTLDWYWLREMEVIESKGLRLEDS